MTAVLLPTTRQAAILSSLQADPSVKVSSQTLFVLWEHGWVDPESGTVTDSGLSGVASREALDIFRDAEGVEARNVRVTKRNRGRSPIRGVGRVPDGRNVMCMACFRAGGDSIVWFTNESYAPAQRAAEIAAGKHILRHRSGALPPFESTSS